MSSNRLFDYEVYDQEGSFVDILTMYRTEIKDYKKKNPNYTLKEIGYADDGTDDSWDFGGKKGRDIQRVRIPRKFRDTMDVYKTS